jgi:hypothetical protein
MVAALTELDAMQNGCCFLVGIVPRSTSNGIINERFER